jgi:hypothetical protein
MFNIKNERVINTTFKFVIDIDWLKINKGSGPRGPDAPRPYERALCAPNRNHGSPVALPKLQMAPKPMFLMSPGSRKKEPRCVCLSEAQAPHSHRTWAEVSSFMPHPYTQGCLPTPVGRDAFSGRYAR